MFIADPVWRFATVAPAMVRPLSLAGSMWPTVVIRKNDLFWQQTDDEHPSCVYVSRDVRRGLCDCRHYELCGYTDESSATRTFSTAVRFENRTLTVVCLAVRARIYTGFVGLAVINPTLFCCRLLPPACRCTFRLPVAGRMWLSECRYEIQMRCQQP